MNGYWAVPVEFSTCIVPLLSWMVVVILAVEAPVMQVLLDFENTHQVSKNYR